MKKGRKEGSSKERKEEVKEGVDEGRKEGRLILHLSKLSTSSSTLYADWFLVAGRKFFLRGSYYLKIFLFFPSLPATKFPFLSASLFPLRPHFTAFEIHESFLVSLLSHYKKKNLSCIYIYNFFFYIIE